MFELAVAVLFGAVALALTPTWDADRIWVEVGLLLGEIVAFLAALMVVIGSTSRQGVYVSDGAAVMALAVVFMLLNVKHGVSAAFWGLVFFIGLTIAREA